MHFYLSFRRVHYAALRITELNFYRDSQVHFLWFAGFEIFRRTERVCACACFTFFSYDCLCPHVLNRLVELFVPAHVLHLFVGLFVPACFTVLGIHVRFFVVGLFSVVVLVDTRSGNLLLVQGTADLEIDTKQVLFYDCCTMLLYSGDLNSDHLSTQNI